MGIRQRFGEWFAYKALGLPRPRKAFGLADAAIGPSDIFPGAGQSWAQEKYGEYYCTSTLVYSAVKLRADAVVRVPLRVYRNVKDGYEEVEATHPLSQLLSRVNPFWTRGDLWRGTSTYLDLWGSAFWVLTLSGSTPSEIWLARPDKMKVLADKAKYIKGFQYEQGGRRVNLLPEEVVWFRLFNPLDEFAGFSPVAAGRMSADMGIDALKYNRNAFKNGLLFSNVAFEAQASASDPEIEEFLKRMAKRYSGSEAGQRPLVLQGMQAKLLGFSPREMEYLGSLRWSLEEISRIYGVPAIMLGDMTNSTYANFDRAEIVFWRNIASYLQFLQEEINEMFVPKFGADLFVEFDLSEVEALQPNINAIWERLRANVASGVMTANEARAEMNMEPVAWGDAWWAPLALYPVKSGTSPAPTMEEANGKGLYKSKIWDDARLDALCEIHIKRLDRHERRFVVMLSKMWGKQLQDILKRLRQQKAVAKQLGPDLFDATEWDDALAAAALPLIRAAVSDSGQAQAAQFGLGAFDINRPLLQSWLRDRAAFWASRVNEETARLLMQEIEAASQAGEGLKQIQERMEKVFRFNDEVRSERIARTEMQAATNRGALEAYNQSEVVEGKMWISASDERVREAHLEAHGQVVPKEAPFLVGGEELMFPGDGSPENAINCILPNNVPMANGILAASRAKYTGAVLELTTEKGHILTVTPNHFILTSQGFMAAQELCPGNYLFCGNMQDGVSFVNQNITDMPATIEEIYSALNVVFGASNIRSATPADFNGDGRRMDADIQIVGTDGQLWCACQAQGFEPVHKLELCRGDILERSLFSLGSPIPFIYGAGHTSDSIMSSGSQTATLLRRSMGHTHEHSLAAVARLDAMLEQVSTDDGARDIIGLRQRLLRFPSEITLDKLVDIRHLQFSGHVYDLQTIDQLYTCNGIFVHNCRCSIVPVLGKAFKVNGGPPGG